MFQRRLVWGAVFFALALFASAQTSMPFKLVDGSVISGRAIAGKDAFVQVAMDGGGYTNLNWARLSQETLKQLQEHSDRAVAAYAGIFVDPPPSTRRSSATRPKAITIKEPPRLERPAGGSLMASPVMLVLLLIVYAANIYAGFEISIFRQQPPALVCVAAAIIPIVAPIIFLSIPPRQPKEEHAPADYTEEMPAVEETAAPVEQAPAPDAAAQQQPAVPQAVTYARGQFTFNRRFFETKFAGFLKVVPGEAERDKVIHVKSARGEHVGQRFSKIEPNEVYLQVKKGNATEDVMLPFSEIYEVTIKHKDA